MNSSSGNKTLWMVVATLLFAFLTLTTFVYAYPANNHSSATQYGKSDTPPNLTMDAKDIYRIGSQYTVHANGRFPPLQLSASNSNVSLSQLTANSWSLKPVEVGVCTLILTDNNGNTLKKRVEIKGFAQK